MIITITFLLLIITTTVVKGLNFSIPEQYATVLTSSQWTPTLPVQSPFLGILYMTVTALPNYTPNASLNMFQIDSFLYHNVDYATDAAVYGPGLRGSNTTNAVRLFLLYPNLQVPNAFACPIYSSTIVDEDVMNAMRNGLLYALITSNGQDAGELRGQIETRNDIYFTPLIDPLAPINANKTNTTTANMTVTGAAIVRIYNAYPNCGSNKKEPVLTAPVAIDYYILSSTEFNKGFLGIPVGSGLVSVDFGTMPTNVASINLLFDTGSCIFRRGDIEVIWPAFGYGSSNMSVFFETYNFDNGVYNRTLLGNLLRLPYFKVLGNELFVFEFNSTANNFGNGPPPADVVIKYESNDRMILLIAGTILFFIAVISIGFTCVILLK
jgi:hypothetical protein